MRVPIPAQYASQVATSWSAYQYSLLYYGPSMQLTSLSVLCVWLNRCNLLLGHPAIPKPYQAPPNAAEWRVAPAVVVDENGEMTGELEYPA